MNQIKRILLLAAILTILTAHQAFAAVRETKEPSTTSSSSSAPKETSPTFNEPKGGSVLDALPPSPQSNPPDTAAAYRPPTDGGKQPTPDCVPPSPNCPEYGGYEYPNQYPSIVYPINNICPSGYYCRASIIPIPGGRDATCTVNETELSDFYRDCDKVINLCRNSKPQDVGEIYKQICSL